MEIPLVGSGVPEAAPPLPAALVRTPDAGAPAPPGPTDPPGPPAAGPPPLPLQRAALAPVEPPIISREQMVALILAAVAGTS